MIRKPILLLLLIITVIPAFSQLQSPRDFLGYAIGEKFTPHWKVVSYFNHVAANAGSMVKLQQYGTTNEERPLIVAFVSSANNINNLEQIRLNNLRLSNITNDGTAA